MSRQDRFMDKIRQHGASAVLSVYTGTRCPCVLSGGNNAVSEEWHRLNPSAKYCSGTGLITRTTTATNVKGFFFQIGAINTLGLPEIAKTAVGELSREDLIMVGTWNDDNDVYMDLSSYIERRTSMVYDSIQYQIRNVYNYDLTDTVAQAIMLKKATATGDVGLL